MRTLRACCTALAVAALAALAGCGVQIPESSDELPPGFDTEEVRQALAGGNSTHTDTEFTTAHITGTGDLGDGCVTMEATVRVYSQTTMEPGGPTDRQWMWVRVRRFCCDDTDIMTQYTGSVTLADGEYDLSLPANRHRLWDGSGAQTVTVHNRSGGSDTMDVTVNLVWDGLDDFRQRTETRHLNGDLVRSYSLQYCPAILSGEVLIDGITFDFGTQQHVWIEHLIQTTHDR
ncbi:hypothetical protein ACFL26_02460 [Patescibacteria group bacterium]